MMKPATRINEFCLDILEFCEEDPYLQRFYPINTQKEILIPGTDLGWINRFWVTPKGKKLINRLVRYYIKIGKIQ